MTRSVERVVIVGRDAAAWLSAIALHRAFGRVGVSVQVVELPSLLDASDLYSTTPSLAGLHRLLGVKEHDILRVCRGLPVVAQRFSGWSGEGSAFVHGYDGKRAAIEGIDFLQFWVKARAQGLRVAFEDFSMAAAAAKQGRLSPRGTDPEAFGNVVPGYHLHARAYAGAMRRLALDRGIDHLAGELAGVERDGDRIRSILLKDGSAISGDFFVDATGPDGLLIGEQPGGARESWSHWLPCDRMLTGSGPSLTPLPAFSEIAAFPSGWIGLFPLQDRTAVKAVYSSAHASEGEVLDAVAKLVPLQGEPAATAFCASGRAQWIGNCCAIGDAAASLEPLDAVQLHVVHAGLSNLIALFPVDGDVMPEASAYNEVMSRHIFNVRDFQISHYRLNRRLGEPLWDGARRATGPASLEAKLGLFASRGKVPLYDDESFEEQNWAAIFVGHGLIPRSHDPMVETIPIEEQQEKFQRLLSLVASEVRAMPTVGAYLAAGGQPQTAGMFQ